MGGKNSVQVSNNLLDYSLSQEIKVKVKNLLSIVEEKTMRILILLTQINDNYTYSQILRQILQQGNMYQLLENIDFIAQDVNERLDMLYYDMFHLFDEKINPQEFKFIRHSISGDTYELFRRLGLRNKKGKVAKWNTVYDWVFDGVGSLEKFYDQDRYINFRSIASISSGDVKPLQLNNFDNTITPIVKGGNFVRGSQSFDKKFKLSKLSLSQLNNKVLSIDMNLNDHSLILATMGGNIQKLTKTGGQNILTPIFKEKIEIVAIRITNKNHIFYITQDHTLRLLRNGSKIPRDLLLDVKIRQNGKNLKVFGNELFVQQGDFCIYKLDVKNVDRILSQRLKLSENFGILKDFDYFYSKLDIEIENEQFNLTQIRSSSRNKTQGNKLFEGIIAAITSKGSLQLIDGKRKVYQLHQLKKVATNQRFLSISISNQSTEALISVGSFIKGNTSKQPSSYIDVYKLNSLDSLVLIKKIHLQGKSTLLTKLPKMKKSQDRMEFMDFHYNYGKNQVPILIGILSQSQNFISFEYTGKQMIKFSDKFKMHNCEILTMVRKGDYVITLGVDGSINVVTVADVSQMVSTATSLKLT